jgi:amylosucrase
VAYSYGGIPLVYMGDELALPNDTSYRNDPATRDDSCWMHRPRMDWDAAERRGDLTTIEGRVFAAFRVLAEARKRLIVLRAGADVRPLPTEDPHVFAYLRRHPRSGPFLGLANFDVDAPVQPEAHDPVHGRAAQLRRRPPGSQRAGAVRAGDVFG